MARHEVPFSTERVGIHVEIPIEVRDQLRESAEANDRKFTAEVIRAFRYYLEHGQ